MNKNNIIEDISKENVKALLADHILVDLLHERKTERRWKWIKRIAFSTISVVLFTIYLAFYASNLGYKVIPNSEVVAIINVFGEIAEGKLASADELVPVLEKVFKLPNVKAIALNIDSPGGQPFESERIGQVIDQLKVETHKPIYGFIGNTGASAAYMLALHTDKIIAGRYSLVGSIGAVITGWDLHKLADKFDVGQRVFASGIHKNMLNPFVEMSKASDLKAQEMVNQMAEVFNNEFKDKRGTKIKTGFIYTTGEVWGGYEALSLGLIDEIGTIESVINKEFKLPTYNFGPENKTKGIFSKLGLDITDRFLTSYFDQHVIH
jgi:protease-4